MSLTPKQEAFCQAAASGMTQADAYRHAYDVSEDTKPETIYSRASELMADGKVSGRVQELRDELQSDLLWSRKDSIIALKEIYDKAKNSQALGEATKAVKELNAMHGYNAPVKTAITDSNGNDMGASVFFVIEPAKPNES
jgi:phage terminase small subunit